MKKTLVALAALAATSAFAQSSVEIYGVIDQAYNQVKSSGVADNKVTTVGSANPGAAATTTGSGNLQGSRIGFRGTEDMGGGNKALFVLEYGINISRENNADAQTTAETATGTAIQNARQSYVGLQTSAGTFLTGTMYAFHSGASGALATQTAYGGTNHLLGADGLNRYGFTQANPRAANAVAYVSPTVNGFTGKAAIHFGEAVQNPANNVKTNRATSVAVDYVQGPLKAGVAQTNYKDVAIAANTVLVDLLGTNNSAATYTDTRSDITNTTYGANYKFSFATLGYNHSAMKQDSNTVANTGMKAGHNTFSASIPVAPNVDINIGYALGSIKQNGADLYKTRGYDLIGVYSLSKRTNVYAALAQAKFDNQNAGAVDLKNSTTAIGLRHSF